MKPKLNCPTYKSRRKRKYVLFLYSPLAIQLSKCLRTVRCNVQELCCASSGFTRYGTSVCSMSNSDGITYYLYIPISVLLLLNTVFFLATVITMVKYKKGIRDVFNGISNNTSTKADQSFGIYARLFIIMGIFWITQIVCWFALPQTSISIKNSELTSVQKINAVVDALTVLQAVVIFYIFACKRSVFVNLWNLQPWLNPFLSLCISGGCCTTPPDTGRRISLPSQSVNSTMKGALKSRKGSNEAANHRMSTESNKTIVLNVRNPGLSITREDSRKISVTSNETVISHVELGCKVSGVTDDKRSGLSKTEIKY
ncbi:G-protein coupled receptor Mth2 [Orchesella cincta]|uniref:G-protein coupled receptor Mth2 n=1 Tax=Orchesella cincta TaxID=48709 RepID=A0A1D2MHG7_ORCCI|nr:G-protein coupled receptor Mth2 [Orchesella cincta]